MSDLQTAGKIPSEVLYNTGSKLDEIIGVFEPYQPKLAPGERRPFCRFGAEFIKFLELSHAYAVEAPGLFPAFTDRDSFREDFLAANELWILINKVNRLREEFWDTEMLLGCRALKSAKAFYQTVKIAARHDIPAARVVFDELKPAFPRSARRRRKPKAEEKDRQLYLFADSA